MTKETTNNTETTETETVEQEPSNDASTGDAAQAVDETTDDEQTTGNREAAKYRRRLRDAEAERDTAREQVDALQRGMLKTRLATFELAHTGGGLVPRAYARSRDVGPMANMSKLPPEALDDAGINPADVFENGTIDDDKLEAALFAVYEQKPYLFKTPPRGPVVPVEGLIPQSQGGTGGFTAAFAPPHK